MEALLEAIRKNQSGDYTNAQESAEAAALLFGRRAQAAGELRARFEAVYAQRAKLHGADCSKLTAPLWHRLGGTSYFWLKGEFLLEQAECRNFQGDFAGVEHDVAESRRNAASFPVLKSRITGIYAGMQAHRGRCDEAWSQAQEGLKLYSSGLYPPERLGQFYGVMWQCARDQGHLYVAEVLLRWTLAMRESPNSRIPKNLTREAMLHLHLGNILSARGELIQGAAESAYAEASLNKMSLPPDYIQEFELTTKIEPAELLINQGHPARAAKLLEAIEPELQGIQDKFIWLSFYRVMGDAYEGSRQPAAAMKAYNVAINLAEGVLKTLPNAPTRLQWLKGVEESYRGEVRVFIGQGRQQDALAKWEWFQSRSLAKPLTADNHFQSTADDVPHPHFSKTLQTSHDNDRLVYAFFKDGFQIWVVQGQSIRGIWTPRPAEYMKRAIRDFEELCSSPDKVEETKKSGVLLYQLLFAPAERELTGVTNVKVELDRIAYNLPMEALRHPKGWYLAEKFSFTYSPGGWSDTKAVSQSTVDKQTRILFLDSGAELPGKQLEKRAISGFFPHMRIVTSRADLFLLLSRSTVLHTSGHGEVDGAGTDLVLRDGSVIKSGDLTPKSLKSLQLAVLEACSTGIGNQFGLLDTANLVRPFLLAGTPAVIASRWNVDSTATSELMIEFYRHLAHSETPSQSLAAARLKLISNPKYSHPYYWAGFRVIGRLQ